MKAFNVEGKVALVTGANRGIGLAYVETLVKRGASKVYACARDTSALDQLAAIDKDIVEATLLDVTSAEHIESLKAKITTLDLLINNAGILDGCLSSADNATEIAQKEMQTNYYAPMNLVHAFLPLLRQSKGAIINISSIAGISCFPSIGPYSATKAALHSLTQGLRTELDADGILVVGVYPGPIDTRMAKEFEMEKASPGQVAERTFDSIKKGDVTIMPDAFSEQMYAAFLNSPADIEQVFADMHREYFS